MESGQAPPCTGSRIHRIPDWLQMQLRSQIAYLFGVFLYTYVNPNWPQNNVQSDRSSCLFSSFKSLFSLFFYPSFLSTPSICFSNLFRSDRIGCSSVDWKRVLYDDRYSVSRQTKPFYIWFSVPLLFTANPGGKKKKNLKPEKQSPSPLVPAFGSITIITTFASSISRFDIQFHLTRYNSIL